MNSPRFNFLVLCAALLAGSVAFACTRPFGFIPLWQGAGAFGTSHQVLVNMGSARSFLEGSTVTTLTVIETNYDGLCRSLGFRFTGSTSAGYTFGGTATPERIESIPLNSPGFTMNVTAIAVTNAATGQQLATDDGGFKLDYVAVAPRPSIRLTRNVAGLTLAWDTSATGFVPERAATPYAPANQWTQVSPPYQTNGATISVQLPATNAAGFFRLRKS